MTKPDDWGSLEAKFEQLRKESAINSPLNPASRLKAVWYPKTEPDEEWSFEYWGGDDGLAVTDRYKWLGCEAAALLGFSAMDDTAAIAYWLTELERHAPKAYKKAHRFSTGSDGADELYCVELFDLCGFSAWFCRKCKADAIRQAARVETVNARESPNVVMPTKPTTVAGAPANGEITKFARQPESAGAIFRRQGDVWTLALYGHLIHLPHSKGLGYIAELLRSPHRIIEAVQLAGMDVEDTAVRVSSGIELADEEGIQFLRKELSERERELAGLDKADWARKGKLEDEIGHLKRHLAQVATHEGKPRKVGGTAQRARSAVTNAINRAVDWISGQHPDLGRHLKESINTGTVLIYLPTEVPDWSF